MGVMATPMATKKVASGILDNWGSSGAALAVAGQTEVNYIPFQKVSYLD